MPLNSAFEMLKGVMKIENDIFNRPEYDNSPQFVASSLIIEGGGRLRHGLKKTRKTNKSKKSRKSRKSRK